MPVLVGEVGPGMELLPMILSPKCPQLTTFDNEVVRKVLREE